MPLHLFSFMQQLMSFEMNLFGLSSSSMVWSEWKDISKCALPLPFHTLPMAVEPTNMTFSDGGTTSLSVGVVCVSSHGSNISSSSTKKTKPQPTPIQREALDAFVQTHITPEFLQQGVREVCGGPYEMQFMGEVLQWLNNNIRASTSSAEVLRMEGVSWKEISHFIDKSSKHWLKGL